MTWKDRGIIYVLDPLPIPLGGVATIYRLVEILSKQGMPAFVALPQKPAVDFYDTTAPLLIHGGRPEARNGDVLVIPEG